MPKASGAYIQQSIETFNMGADTGMLSHAFKVAKTQQEYHKKTSEEFTILEKFKNTLMRVMRSRRKGPTIEELDVIAQKEAENHVQPDISARDVGVED